MSKRAMDRVRQAPRSKRVGGGYNPRRTKLIGFETVSEAKRQDMLRVKGLQQAIDRFPEQIDVPAARAFDAIDRGGGRIVEHAEEDIRHSLIARDFAALSPQDRARTLVLDPTREGRQRLTDTIRLALVKDGTLGEDAVFASVLQARDLTRAEAAHAASYAPGSIVTFRRGSREQRLSKGIGYRVSAVDADAGTVALVSPRGRRVDWSPARWGGDQAEAFDEVEQEFRTGDRIQFTRNNRRAGRLNGHTASIIGIDPERGGITIEREDGKHEALDLSRLADRHIRPGWVRTIHSAQGATADRVMAHLESFRANTVDAPAVYVAISRAKDAVALYTDSRARLTQALGLRDGAQVGAIDETRAIDNHAAIGMAW